MSEASLTHIYYKRSTPVILIQQFGLTGSKDRPVSINKANVHGGLQLYTFFTNLYLCIQVVASQSGLVIQTKVLSFNPHDL